MGYLEGRLSIDGKRIITERIIKIKRNGWYVI
jgi:hypothetical protein